MERWSFWTIARGVNVTWKHDGNVNFGNDRSDLPVWINWIGKKEPAAETNVAVICFLSSRPLIRIFLDPLEQNVYFPGETYDREVWLSLRTRSTGILFSTTTCDIALWNENFSSSENFFESSTFPVVPFLFTHSVDFNTVLAQFSVSSRGGRHIPATGSDRLPLQPRWR